MFTSTHCSPWKKTGLRLVVVGTFLVATAGWVHARTPAPRTPTGGKAPGGQTKAQRLKKVTASLTAATGKTVRLTLDDGRVVEGAVLAVDAKELSLKTYAGSMRIALAVVAVVQMTRQRHRARKTSVDRKRQTAASALRASATTLEPSGHGTRQPISASFHKRMVLKYKKISASGARLRSWGLGIWIGGMVLNAIGGVILLSDSGPGGTKAGVAMSLIGGALDLPGIIMAIWGHHRYNRGMDMETLIRLAPVTRRQ